MLEEIFQAVGLDVQDQWKRHAPEQIVTVEITDDAVNYEEAPPRIVFCPQDEPITGKDVASQDGKKEPAHLFTRNSNVQVHIWGENRTATEELLHAVMRASYNIAYGSYKNAGGRWLQRSTTKLGNVYLLNVIYQIPVPRETEPRRLITAFQPLTLVLDKAGI